MKQRKKRKSKVDLIGRYPSHLRGFATNKHGGNKLQREEGFAGNTYGAAGDVRVYTKEEREEYERHMRERGDLK
jgi:hypothetical protein